MRIDELFDQPAKLKWNDLYGGEAEAYFKLDGVGFKIVFAEAVQKYADQPQDVTEVSFGVDGKAHNYAARSQEPKVQSKTVVIFSTVANAIDVYFKKYKPDAVHFTPAGGRLHEMYEKFADYINSKDSYPYYIEQMYDEDTAEYYFEIVK